MTCYGHEKNTGKTFPAFGREKFKSIACSGGVGAGGGRIIVVESSSGGQASGLWRADDVVAGGKCADSGRKRGGDALAEEDKIGDGGIAADCGRNVVFSLVPGTSGLGGREFCVSGGSGELCGRVGGSREKLFSAGVAVWGRRDVVVVGRGLFISSSHESCGRISWSLFIVAGGIDVIHGDLGLCEKIMIKSTK